MVLDEDQVLIKKILEGKRSSFEELMKKYNRKIYTYIYHMVKEEEASIELTQDFFIKLYRVLHKYNFQYKFTTWAYRICYNLVIDYFRANPANISSLDDETVSPRQMVESNNYVKDDVSERLEKDQLKAYTWQVVERIPQKYRELVLLRYVQEMRYDEIAEITNLPVGTVRSRIFKAKKIIRKEVEKDGLFN